MKTKKSMPWRLITFSEHAQDVHITSPFLALPPELRNKIYGYLFSGNILQIIELGGPKRVRLYPANTEFNATALLRANRQIYTEASNLVFATNMFVFFSIRHIRAFVKCLPPLKLALVTTLVFQTWRGKGFFVGADQFMKKT